MHKNWKVSNPGISTGAERCVCGEVFLFFVILFLLHSSETFHVNDSVPGCNGWEDWEEKQRRNTIEAKEESSLPVLACPFSPSQKLQNIQTAPASSGFLLLPQYPCCLRLSWTPVNRAMRDHAFCSPIFSCTFWSLSPFPKQPQKQEVSATLHWHSYSCKCCGSTPRVG